LPHFFSLPCRQTGFFAGRFAFDLGIDFGFLLGGFLPLPSPKRREAGRGKKRRRKKGAEGGKVGGERETERVEGMLIFF